MKLEKRNIQKLSIVVLSLTLALLIFFSTNSSNSKVILESYASPQDINSLIEKIEKDNPNLEKIYENNQVKDFKSIIYKNETKYQNLIIDTKTGKEITFTDLIKIDKNDKFAKKELELLKLKYPEFIVDDIKNNKGNTGYKTYYVKDNEVIIYYYDYLLSYEIQDKISLIINYNEIKDFLNFTPTLDKSYQNEDGYNYTNSKKTVALTFDDGPSKKYNSLILEELAKNKAHATFFMVGTMMDSCGKCVVDTYKSGNEVASHTYSHINIKRSKSEEVKENIAKLNTKYNELTGDNIKYLRPPYGAYNKNNLDTINMPLILWDLDTEDWRYRDVDHIVNYIIENVNDGSIILMHELYETSYEALKIALPKLYSMGYQVVSITELAKIKNRTLEPGHAYRKIL